VAQPSTKPQSSIDESLIDKFLPTYDFHAMYQIRVDAPPATVYQALLHAEIGDHWLTRLLMTLRTGKRMQRNRAPGDLPQRLQGSGFVVLEELPNDEIVIGVAGRFWRPDGERCMDIKAANFTEFSRTGYAKAVWNFLLRAEPAAATATTATILSTETRIQCFGSALWKFRLYWTIVGPFSGLIRHVILRQVKIKAESE
jgi:hypothetical protein